MYETFAYNVHNINNYAAHSSAYFERHQLLGILQELLVRVVRERPCNVRKYMAEQLTRIGATYKHTFTTVLAPPIIDTSKLSKRYNRMYGAPIIQYTRKREPNDVHTILRKFRRFACKMGLNRKNVISFNFPGTRPEMIECVSRNVIPNTVVEIQPGTQIPFKSHEAQLAANRPFQQDFKQLKDYLPERSVDLQFGVRPNSLCQSFSNVCRFVQSRVLRPRMAALGDYRLTIDKVAGQKSRNSWHPRMVLIGRLGSGRKTQAALLARKLQLIFVDVDHLLLHQIELRKPISDVMQSRCQEQSQNADANIFVLNAVKDRLARADCMHNGYVLVGFGKCADDLRELVGDPSSKSVAPNRIVFLHTRERVCVRRLQRQIDRHERLVKDRLCIEHTEDEADRPPPIVCTGLHLLISPFESHRFIEREHWLFNKHQTEMVRFCESRHCRQMGVQVDHVNGARSLQNVHDRLLSCAFGRELPAPDAYLDGIDGDGREYQDVFEFC